MIARHGVSGTMAGWFSWPRARDRARGRRFSRPKPTAASLEREP
jgi:hypothetical protein